MTSDANIFPSIYRITTDDDEANPDVELDVEEIDEDGDDLGIDDGNGDEDGDDEEEVEAGVFGGDV